MGFFDDIFGGGEGASDSGSSGWGTALGIGASLFGSYLGAESAKDAAKTQAGATNKANEQIWKMYQQSRQDQMPWMKQGSAAVNRLGYLLGLGNQPAMQSGSWDISKAPPGWGGTQNPAIEKIVINGPRTNPMKAAQVIGAANSKGGQDTILAHINPSEAAMLQARGGSGRIDPMTGLPHFEENDETSRYDNEGRAYRADGSEIRGGEINSHEYREPSKWKQALGRFLGGTMGGMVLGPAGKLAGGWLGGQWGKGGMVSNRNYGGFNSPSGDFSSRAEGKDGPLYGGYQSGGGMTGKSANGWDSMSPSARQAAWASYYGSQGQPSSAGGYGSLMQDFGMDQYQADPGYQFRLDQANKALDRSAAARGTFGGGGYLKDLSALNQGLASQEYQSAYDRYMNNRSSKYNMLASLSGLGQTSAGTLGGYGMNTGSNIGSNLMNLGAGQSASQLAQGNAWQGGINNATNLWNQYLYS